MLTINEAEFYNTNTIFDLCQPIGLKSDIDLKLNYMYMGSIDMQNHYFKNILTRQYIKIEVENELA